MMMGGVYVVKLIAESDDRDLIDGIDGLDLFHFPLLRKSKPELPQAMSEGHQFWRRPPEIEP